MYTFCWHRTHFVVLSTTFCGVIHQFCSFAPTFFGHLVHFVLFPPHFVVLSTTFRGYLTHFELKLEEMAHFKLGVTHYELDRAHCE